LYDGALSAAVVLTSEGVVSCDVTTGLIGASGWYNEGEMIANQLHSINRGERFGSVAICLFEVLEDVSNSWSAE
jgi:hypothetical protein